ncbi:hypothetical protein C2G38_2232062 [Gigaspora rosea]|uniref:SAP domain-containing protein n=1 Tax=Gigaspora rosea TaxID=44941 RepID=A0A397U1U3_9GLOM|nr:hypothetical protein C2G38_2232062 [Gigaspora rosea]
MRYCMGIIGTVRESKDEVIGGGYLRKKNGICSPPFVFAAELDASPALSLVPCGRRKIKKMVLVQDENEVQEVLPATLTLESGEGYDVEESSHQGLKSTLERLPVETLKLLCNGEGLSEAGVKRDLVERLAERVVSKSRRKVRIDDDGQGNNGNSDLQFLALERSLEKLIQASLEKAVGEIRRSVQVMQNGEESRYWPREKFGKARDQFEYDEWCKVGRTLDNALVNRDLEMIGKVRDVAATRAFTLRVAKREGWNVAAGIRDLLDDDPKERNGRYGIEPDGALVHAGTTIFSAAWPTELPTDYLMRVWDVGDWELDDRVFFNLEEKWGPLTVDRFANHLNTKKKWFNSYHFCPKSEAIDCFTQDWELEMNHTCPPFGLVHQKKKEVVYPAKVDTVKAFLGWLEMAGLAPHVHRKKGYKSPVEDFRVREVLRGIN